MPGRFTWVFTSNILQDKLRAKGWVIQLETHSQKEPTSLQPELISSLGHYFGLWDSPWKDLKRVPSFPMLSLTPVTPVGQSCPPARAALPRLNRSKKLITVVTWLRSGRLWDCQGLACPGPSRYVDFSHQTRFPATEVDWMLIFLISPFSESMTRIFNVFTGPGELTIHIFFKSLFFHIYTTYW